MRGRGVIVVPLCSRSRSRECIVPIDWRCKRSVAFFHAMYCQTGSLFSPWLPIPQFDLNFAEENLQELAVNFPDLVAGLLTEFGHLTGQILLQAALYLLLQQVNFFPVIFCLPTIAAMPHPPANTSSCPHRLSHHAKSSGNWTTPQDTHPPTTALSPTTRPRRQHEGPQLVDREQRHLARRAVLIERGAVHRPEGLPGYPPEPRPRARSA